MRLIDADALKKEVETSRETTDAFIELINDAPTYDTMPFFTEGYERARKETAILYKKQIARLDKKIERKDKVIDAQISCLRAVINENESLRNELLRQLKFNLKEEAAEEYAEDFMSEEVTGIINQFAEKYGDQNGL